MKSPKTIKGKLDNLFMRGYRLGASKWVSKDEQEHGVSEALAQIKDLIEGCLPKELGKLPTDDFNRTPQDQAHHNGQLFGYEMGYNKALADTKQALKRILQ